MNNSKKDASNEKETNATVNKSKSIQTTIRPETVKAARRFMLMPKVQQTSLEQQREFLLGKGVRDEEIDEAMKGLPSVREIPKDSDLTIQQYAFGTDSSPNWQKTSNSSILSSSGMQIVKYAVVLTSVSYAGWCLMRSIVLPRFFGICDKSEERMRFIEEKMIETQAMVQNVMTAVGSTLKKINDQQAVLDQILCGDNNDLSTKAPSLFLANYKNVFPATQFNEIQKGIQNISALLVGQEQFPSPRPPLKKRTSSSHPKTTTSASSGLSHHSPKRSSSPSKDSLVASDQSKENEISGQKGSAEPSA